MLCTEACWCFKKSSFYEEEKDRTNTKRPLLTSDKGTKGKLTITFVERINIRNNVEDVLKLVVLHVDEKKKLCYPC